MFFTWGIEEVVECCGDVEEKEAGMKNRSSSQKRAEKSSGQAGGHRQSCESTVGVRAPLLRCQQSQTNYSLAAP